MGGDGIVIHLTINALIEKCTAYSTGKITRTLLGTTSAIWNFDCDTCTVQFNEAYLSHTSAGSDAGDYDSDYYNKNVTIQYNYGHDADGYCVSVFGARVWTLTSTRSSAITYAPTMDGYEECLAGRLLLLHLERRLDSEFLGV